MKETTEMFIAGILLSAMLSWVIYLIVVAEKDEWWRKETARRGFSHFYVDDNYNRQWNWLEPK